MNWFIDIVQEEIDRQKARLGKDHGAQAAAAKRLGISEDTLSKWIRGGQQPRLPQILTVMERLGVTFDRPAKTLVAPDPPTPYVETTRKLTLTITVPGRFRPEDIVAEVTG